MTKPEALLELADRSGPLLIEDDAFEPVAFSLGEIAYLTQDDNMVVMSRASLKKLIAAALRSKAKDHSGGGE